MVRPVASSNGAGLGRWRSSRLSLRVKAGNERKASITLSITGCHREGASCAHVYKQAKATSPLRRNFCAKIFRDNSRKAAKMAAFREL